MQETLQFFSGLEDPRVERSKVHQLEDIMFITIIAVLCGAETWNDIEEFGKSKQDWLRGFLTLPAGIPTHDTFNRVFSALNPEKLETGFLEWTAQVARRTKGEVISIDGKALRGSRQGASKSMVHMVSAWASENNIVLGQQKVDAKSNEITAIPKLLELLVVKGCIVTIDAMGCQKEIAAAIADQQADYILALKGNQGTLHEQVQDSFRFLKTAQSAEEYDMGHGRIEHRRCTVLTDLSMIDHAEEWQNLRSLIRIESERTLKATGESQKETRYYISSLSVDAATINRAIRTHWYVENSLHWTLDVAFREDHSRKRAGHAAQNFSIINRIALNLLKNETSLKSGIKGKRLKAGWDNNYLLKIMKN